MNYQEVILTKLNESLLEDDDKTKKAIAQIIKILTEKSLYDAALYDFYTICSNAKIGGVKVYFDIPDIRQAFYDKILQDEEVEIDLFNFHLDIIDIMTMKLEAEDYKSKPDFIEFIKKLNYKQFEKLYCKNILEVLNDKEYYDILFLKAKGDKRFYEFIPYNTTTIGLENFDEIASFDPEGKKILNLNSDMQIKVLEKFKSNNILSLKNIFSNFLNLENAVQQYIIEDKNLRERLIRYNSKNTSESKIPKNLEKDIVEKSSEFIKNLSSNEKYNFISKMNDPQAQKYIIKTINFIKSLLVFENFGTFFLYIKDKSFLIECLMEEQIISNINYYNFENIIKQLPKESIELLTNHPNFQNYISNLEKYYIVSLFSYCDETIIDNYIENSPQILLSDLMTFFKNSKNHKYIERIKERIKKELEVPTEESIEKIQSFLDYNIFGGVSNNVFKLLSDEEFNYFLNLYDFSNEITKAKNLFSNISSFKLTPNEQEIYQSIEFDKELSEEELNVLEKHRKNQFIQKKIETILFSIKDEPTRIIEEFEYNLLSELTEEQRKIFLDHLTYSCLIDNLSSCKIVIEYCEQLLKENPSVFDDIEPQNNYVHHSGEDLDEKSLYKLTMIYNSLNEENKKKILNERLLTNEAILNQVKEKIKNEPNYFSGEKYKRLFRNILSYEEMKELLTKINIQNLVLYFNTVSFTFKKYNFESEVITIRKDEIIEYINTQEDNYYLSFSVLNCILSLTENIEETLKKLSPTKLSRIYSAPSYNEESDKINKAIINILKENHSYFLEFSDDEIKKIMCDLNKDEIKDFIKNLNIDEIITLFSKSQNIELEEKIVEEFNKCPYFINQTNHTIEEILSHLEPDNQINISKKIDEQYNELSIPYKIKDKLRKLSYDEKMFLICGIKKGILNEEKLIYINELLNKDPFALCSLDLRLFETKIYNISKNIIKKIYRYKELTNQYINIILKKDKNSLILSLLLEYLNKIINDDNILASKVDCIIKYFKRINNDLLENFNKENITEEELKALAEYIMFNTSEYWLNSKNLSWISKTKFTMEEINAKSFTDYFIKLLEVIDEKINNSDDLNEIKECVFLKFFKLNLEQVELLLRKYNTSLQTIKKNISNSASLEYFEHIKKIYETEDIISLKEIYYSNNSTYNLDSLMIMNNDFTRAYNNEIAQSIKGYKSGKPQTLQINDKKIKVIELERDFEIIIHSTDAYGSLQMINDNYFESWNFSERTDNHGICSSFITSHNLGTARVEGKGVLFGFNKLNENSINLMAPYDIVSKNSDYITTSYKPPMFTDLKSLSDYTRHTHNELVLERRNVDKDSLYPVIQPDFIVIYEEMPIEIKENSLKAQADFAKEGIYLPIIYINRKKVITQESIRVEEMLNIYDKNPDLDLLAEIINRYESNRCGLDFDPSVNVEELFQKDRIYNTIINTINIIQISNDIEAAKKMIQIITFEDHKFQLIIENNPDRAHRFELLDDNLKSLLEELKEKIDKTNDITTGLKQ